MNSGYNLISGLSSLIIVIMIIYILITLPWDIFNRFVRIANGELVDPFSTVFLKFLKYWIVTALIIIPVSCTMTMGALSDADAFSSPQAGMALFSATYGNILTSAVIGLFFLRRNRSRWSVVYGDNVAKKYNLMKEKGMLKDEKEGVANKIENVMGDKFSEMDMGKEGNIENQFNSAKDENKKNLVDEKNKRFEDNVNSVGLKNKGLTRSISDEITKIKALFDEGILSEEEFKKAKRKILNDK